MKSFAQGRFAETLIVGSLALTGIWVGAVRAQEKQEIRHPEPARKNGWQWKALPDLVTPDTGKRNYAFTVGEPLTFRLARKADSFECAITRASLSIMACRHGFYRPRPTAGWYKLYLYGSVTRPEFGDVVGGTMFVVFRKTVGSPPQFPELPSPEPTPDPDGAKDEVMRGITGMGPEAAFGGGCGEAR